ncbi:MAG: hypothetical protein OHK0021_24750 [Bryobacter sp.]
MTASSLPVLLSRLGSTFNRIAKDQRGQDLIEYALLAGFIAVAAAAVFPTNIVPSISTIFEKIVTQINLAASTAS